MTSVDYRLKIPTPHHRDVAARNILVSGENIVKVSNFHLTCEEGSDYQDAYDECSVQWMAPEAIELGVSIKSCLRCTYIIKTIGMYLYNM